MSCVWINKPCLSGWQKVQVFIIRVAIQMIQKRAVILSLVICWQWVQSAKEDYDKAVKQSLGIVDKPVEGKSQFPDFLDIVKRELNTVYYSDDLKNEGLIIISTLDPIAQLAADKAVDKKLGELRRNNSKTKNLQGALVSANPETGELVSVVGSGSEFTGFNRAVDAKRQVGSVVKTYYLYDST